MLRRLKADVEKSLPPKTETILYVGKFLVPHLSFLVSPTNRKVKTVHTYIGMHISSFETGAFFIKPAAKLGKQKSQNSRAEYVEI